LDFCPPKGLDHEPDAAAADKSASGEFRVFARLDAFLNKYFSSLNASYNDMMKSARCINTGFMWYAKNISYIS
jgi:hypothetical protein